MPGSEKVQDEGDRYAAANKRVDLPNPPFWYSYNYGSVHFTSLSSEHDLTKHSQQRKVSAVHCYLSIDLIQAVAIDLTESHLLTLS